MNEMIVFENEQFGNVRVIDRDGELWFVAADVCRALGIINTSAALGRLDDDEKMTLDLTDSHIGQRGGAQFMKIINESGLYALVLGSRKPEAKAFKRWITYEVIPSIWRYDECISDEEQMSDTELIAKALIVAEKKLIEQERRLADLAETIVAQEEQIQAMAPKADFFDELVEQNLLMSIRQTAKELDVRKNDFVSFLLDNRFCYRDTENKLQPFYRYVGEYFELVEDEGSGTQMMITPKGREAFRLLVRARATA